MNFRLATEGDLPEIKSFFGDVISDMKSKGNVIWDDVYPFCALPEDIAKKRLYLVFDNDTLLSVFALCEWSDGEDAVEWEKIFPKTNTTNATSTTSTTNANIFIYIFRYI